MRAIGVAIILASILTGCAAVNGNHGRQETPFAPHYTQSLFQVTEKELFSVEVIESRGELAVGNNAVDIIIHGDGNKDIEDAIINVVPVMSGHGHGVQRIPQVTERGLGRYSVEYIYFNMEGDWELQISIEANGKKDLAVFAFPDIVLLPKKEMSYEPDSAPCVDGEVAPPVKKDPVCRKKSARGLYDVAYKSRYGSIPLNCTHTWELAVKDRDGRPVRGLDIKVNGSMFEHGHGLPTRPKVSRETGAGVYVVEGMKFNVPGQWEVNFYLKQGEETDSVSFDFMLDRTAL